MTHNECYRILQVPEGADTETIKKAYRKRAFELHPDLHPDDPAAAKQFQRLNEAYVHLTKGGSRPQEKSRNERRKQEAEASREQANRAYANAKKNFDASQKQQNSKAKSSSTTTRSTVHSTSSENTGYQQEEVLNDILKDPFARRVFEDIYSQIRSQGGKPAPLPKKKKLSLQWGDSRTTFDMTYGLGAGVKKWMRKQLDDEQTIHLPPQNLVPGARLRIHISQGLSDDKRQIEITLPSDFVVGRPIRLRGLGKKLGPWTGDLYLRVLVRM